MPSKKKKYNARFPAGRIKKIMQTDEEVGKVAQAVPVIISRTLELFVESLLTKSMQITLSRNAKTLTPSHMKQCILSESRFDFLKDLVDNIPDASVQEDNENNALEVIDYSNRNSEDESKKVKTEIAANFYTEQSTSTGRTPVIQYTPKIEKIDTSNIKIEIAPTTPTEPWTVPNLVTSPAPKISFSVESLVKQEPKIHIDLSATGSFSPLPVPNLVPAQIQNPNISTKPPPPPLHPLSNSSYGQNTSDNLYIDEDYDN